MTAGPLDGIVVVDLGQVYNGPYCTMLLRQLGAQVIKVEPPGGEPVRRLRDNPDEMGAAFALLNAGKHSIEIDLKRPDGLAVLEAMAQRADVLVENFAPGVMDRLGLGIETLYRINPRLIVASGKGYGSDSKNRNDRAMDLTVQAMTGVLDVTGFPEHPPVKSGSAVADFAGGAHLALGVLAALYERARTGKGQHVEVAMQDAVLPSLTSPLAGYLDNANSLPHRTGNHQGGLAYCPYNVYRARDGWMAILCIRERHWAALCDLIGPAGNAVHELNNAARVARMTEFDAMIEEWSSRYLRAELFGLLSAVGIPCAPVRDLSEVVAADQDRDRPMLIATPHGNLAFDCPIKMASTSPPSSDPAPQLGAHTRQVMSDFLGFDAAQVEALLITGALGSAR